MESSMFKFIWKPGGFEGFLFKKPASGITNERLTIPTTQDTYRDFYLRHEGKETGNSL